MGRRKFETGDHVVMVDDQGRTIPGIVTGRDVDGRVMVRFEKSWMLGACLHQADDYDWRFDGRGWMSGFPHLSIKRAPPNPPEGRNDRE